MVRANACCVIAVLLGVTGLAQEPKPTFETASVRPQHDRTVVAGASPRSLPGGRFLAGRATVQELLMFAYDLRSYRTISGGPNWIRRDVYYIDARAGFDAPADQIKQTSPPLPGAHLTSLRCEPLSALVSLLSAGSQFPIFDETRLSGKYTMEMRSSSMVPGTVAAGGDPGLPPLAAALQEQLGLKLESRKGPIDVLVIDSIEQPTEN